MLVLVQIHPHPTLVVVGLWQTSLGGARSESKALAMEPDYEMDMYDEEGLESVDDLALVAEIAEGELRELERIQAAVHAHKLSKKLPSQQSKAKKPDEVASGLATMDTKVQLVPQLAQSDSLQTPPLLLPTARWL
jgi:hypothetical protein